MAAIQAPRGVLVRGKEDRFCPRFAVSEEDIDPLHRMVQELLDLRLAQYQQRKIASAAAISPEPFTTITMRNRRWRLMPKRVR